MLTCRRTGSGMQTVFLLSLTGRGAVQKVPTMGVLSFLQTRLEMWNLSFTWFIFHDVELEIKSKSH